MYYFAYGSNMLRQRLESRVGKVGLRGCACLPHHRLTFHKRSNDGSGKCTVFDGGGSGDGVWGVLYELSSAQKLALDRFEGRGYQTWEIITTRNEFAFNAFTYVAFQEWIDSRCRPYSWYKALVLAGALQSGLPHTHIEQIERVPTTHDLDRERMDLHHVLIYDSGYGQLLAVDSGGTPLFG